MQIKYSSKLWQLLENLRKSFGNCRTYLSVLVRSKAYRDIYRGIFISRFTGIPVISCTPIHFHIIDKAIVKKHTSTESNVIIVSMVC